MSTIEDLLKSLQQLSNSSNSTELPNTKETWTRIANKDSFDELGKSETELKSFLQEWISNNPYNNI